MKISKEINELFKKVENNLSGYESRPQQLIMADKINHAFDNEKNLIVEAGTGSGKSFGYLIPVVNSGLKVVISTGTIALQEQLMNKDLPFIVNQFNPDLKYTLAKGRKNYLCTQKFFETQRTVPVKSKEGKLMRKLETKLTQDWNGDFAELEFAIPEIILYEISSDKDDCTHHRCEFFNSCPFRKARAELADSDIIVSNHALYMTDLAGGGTILPDHDFVIFDEAHHLKNISIRAFTVTIGRWASTKLIQKIQKRISPLPAHISAGITSVETEIVSWLFSKRKDTFKLYSDSDFFALVTEEIAQLMKLRSWLNDLEIEQLDLFEKDAMFKKTSHKDSLLSQTSNLISKWEYFLEQNFLDDDDIRVNWAETNKNKLSFEIHSAPISIIKPLKERLWPKRKAILTSATLSINKNCQYTKDQLGLEADDLILDSPFDYTEQSKLYLPNIIMDPNSPEYNPRIASIITDLINMCEGRTLVLFTSIMAMNNVSAAVLEKITYPGKLQGDLPRSKLIKWFKETPNSIIFATSTFWEGIDIPGECLSSVIIDKIPFYNPDDPVVSATVDHMKSINKSWFMEYMLPEATLKIKQGFGRLIRRKTDTGIVCILDPRLTSKAYGQVIINSLPKVPITKKIEEIENFFEILKT